jgi:hypothetical protein
MRHALSVRQGWVEPDHPQWSVRRQCELLGLKWAVELSSYQTRRLLFLTSRWVSDGVFDAKQKKVLRHIADAGGRVAKNLLARKTQHWTVRERDEVIANLKATGQIIEVVESDGKGRPATNYCLPA